MCKKVVVIFFSITFCLFFLLGFSNNSSDIQGSINRVTNKLNNYFPYCQLSCDDDPYVEFTGMTSNDDKLFSNCLSFKVGTYEFIFDSEIEELLYVHHNCPGILPQKKVTTDTLNQMCDNLLYHCKKPRVWALW